MQALIHKTGLIWLEFFLQYLGGGLGEPVQLILDDQGDFRGVEQQSITFIFSHKALLLCLGLKALDSHLPP